MSRRSTQTWRRIGLLTAVTVAVAAAHLWYRNRHGFYDLRIYVDAMHWWSAGHPLYEFTKPDATQGQLAFTYPPFAALLLWPLALLSPAGYVSAYVIASVAMLAVLCWWLLAPLADALDRPRWFVVGTGFVLITALEPIREAFTFGQINFLLWLLVLADLLVLAPRGSRFTGVAIGLATAIKLVPGIFILYLLVTRRWRAAGTAIAVAGAATLLAFAVAPDDSWTFWSHQVLHADGVGQLAYTFNQSLMGTLARLAAPAEPRQWWWLLLALPVLGYGLWRAGRAAASGDELAGLTLAGLTGSLISPVTWVHHLFWFVPALVVLIHAGLRPDARHILGPSPRGALALALVVYATVTVSLVAVFDSGLWQPGGVPGFLLSNWDVLLMLALLALLPISVRKDLEFSHNIAQKSRLLSAGKTDLTSR